jgi:putative membrane-bound dehydrogenase-like protein
MTHRSRRQIAGGLASVAMAIASSASAQESGRITAVTPSPKVPDGFVIELVAKAPDLLWPSAVHCLDDGSLLVAEDMMDMPGPADQPVDRLFLLRFQPDGTFTKTLFADRLYAVMGIQQIDDAIYVMNMPHLTVLRDVDGDGVADQRQELLSDLGPPAPGWPGGFNDHIVSGIRLGMDGYLYVSVGDKGIPLAHGTDGGELQLRGGGVVRVRPDGSHLELVASGTRNHLDVCMNERDHIFTYDNTDDGLGWWTRLTHVMPTGYYGYPWDYHDHPERMLPCMRDDGGGSGVGGLCYREDAWPQDYRGDLFCCDWAIGVVRRYRVEPSGAAYQCTLHEDFVSAGDSGEFRPLDLCESPDGRYLYLADWNHPGWTKPDLAGRLWRIRRGDDRPGAPWRTARKLDGGLREVALKLTNDELLDNLAHPSFNKRVAAQRELSRRLANDPVRKRSYAQGVKSATDARTRRHLVWALANAGAMPDDVLFETLREPSGASVVNGDTRAEIVRAFGQRRSHDKSFVAIASNLVVSDPDLMVRRECAIALGRGRDPGCVSSLVRALDATDDLFVRFAIRQAIHALPCNWSVLIQKYLPMASPRAQQDLWLALRDLYDVELMKQLALGASYATFTKEQRVDAFEVLAAAHRKDPPWNGKWWQTQPAKSPRPPRTDAWEGTEVVVAAISQAFDSKSPEMRAAALAAVRETREPTLLTRVSDLLEKSPIDAERVAALESLIAIRGDLALPDLAPLLYDHCAELRVALVKAYGASRLEGITVRIAPLVADPVTHDVAIEALARHPDPAALPHYLDGLARGGELREVCRGALVAVRAHVRGTLEAMQQRGELAPALLDEARTLYSLPQPIVSWILFGPLARTSHVAALEGDATNVEAALHAGVEGRAGETLHPVVTRAAPSSGRVDLHELLSQEGNVCGYAVARVDVPEACRVKLWIGSDDGASAWVNGKRVLESSAERSWTPDEDKLEVDFVPGPNFVVLRVEQAGGDWCFSAKASEPPTGPLFEGLAPATPPAEFDAKKWRAWALVHAGEPARGRALFYAERGPGCFKCHAVGGVGPKIGPDLRDVGAKYPRAELITSLLDPSNRILDGYQSTNLFLTSGDVLSGLVTAEKDGVVTLIDSNAVQHEVRTTEIRDRRPSRTSSMPTGLVEALTCEQFTDLVGWLESLKK